MYYHLASYSLRYRKPPLIARSKHVIILGHILVHHMVNKEKNLSPCRLAQA